jgi:hypothetical protein
MRAVLRLFQARRSRFCPECGGSLLESGDVVRVNEWIYHRACAPTPAHE